METEKERRESEVEHGRIMEECTRVMEEYRSTEKRLHSHIVKSRLLAYKILLNMLLMYYLTMYILHLCMYMYLYDVYVSGSLHDQ